VPESPRDEQALALPMPRLRPFVGHYIGYRYVGFTPGVHAGLPSRHLTIVVSLGAPLDIVAMPHPAQRPDRMGALVGGLHVAPAMIRHDGNQYGVQLQLTPLGARALSGMPAGELASAVVPLDAVLGIRTPELVDCLATARTWADRFAALDRFLSAQLREPGAIRPEVGFAWQRLLDSRGAARVGTLAVETGWSRRHLTEQFRIEFGLPPKALAKVLRFERAKAMLVRPVRPALARVAAECGYADQAHLARDWRELAGSSPSVWLEAEVLPFVQDGPSLEPAG
jgi:AraC-like DNA-binding protein